MGGWAWGWGQIDGCRTPWESRFGASATSVGGKKKRLIFLYGEGGGDLWSSAKIPLGGVCAYYGTWSIYVYIYI